MKIQRVSVIGSGTMGNGIAHCFAQFGFDVHLIDIHQEALDKALQTIALNLDRQIKKDLLSQADKNRILGRITCYTTLQEGLTEADLVIEAATEKLELKCSLFAEMDRFSPAHAILASNTSSISITRLAAATKRPEQVIGMHFMNPVPVMKLVEIISGHATSAQTTEKIVEVSQQLDKIPVSVKDFPGFIANRILMPMINEAIYAHYEGVAEVEAIDEIMKLGMAHPMGPLQLADFIGLDVCLSILRVLYEGFGNPKYAPCPLLVNMVQAGQLGRKSGRGFYDYSSGK
jgi:3-hydroxybutyryl-CoA dehydrogenase